MFRKSRFLMMCTVFLLALLAACGKYPLVSTIATPTSFKSQEPGEAPTSTIQPTEIVYVPTPTQEEQTDVTETSVGNLCSNTINPCECLGKKYVHDEGLGEIKEDYVGSWHASAFVGSGYNERFVFFSSGNYLFFPSQYECDSGDASCTPSPIEEGVWGIQDSQLNLAKGGDITNVRSISIGKVIDSPADESPYPLKTTFAETTYWLISKDTNLWNPETGDLCD